MVVPNAYRRPERPVGSADVGSPPTVTFQGTLRYPPNAEAARFLVDEVAPELRRLVPDVHIRLVGVSTPSLDLLDDPPRVTVVGQVDDIADELARADVVVVPLRFGSGTRLKVLEAFAHRIPVVSTTLGAEGLGVVDGVHLLVADEPVDVATAVRPAPGRSPTAPLAHRAGPPAVPRPLRRSSRRTTCCRRGRGRRIGGPDLGNRRTARALIGPVRRPSAPPAAVPGPVSGSGGGRRR